MVRSKISLPILAILFLAMLSNGERFGHVAKAQTATSALAAQIRSQGFACDEPQKATRDVKLSRPDYDVWILTCKIVLKDGLSRNFEFLHYEERGAGPSSVGAVTVRLLGNL